MTRLEALPSDYIAELLEYLDSRGIHALLRTGARILRHKVVRSVRGLILRPGLNQQFPFSALKLPHLKSLSVIGSRQIFLRFDKDEKTRSNSSERYNCAITCLSLNFLNSSALFTRPGALSLEERFPSLTDLTLHCSPSDELVESFAELPQSLTTLKLTAVYRNPRTQSFEHSLDLMAIKCLPRSLLTLELGWPSIQRLEGDMKAEELSSVFPPGLTSLHLSSLSEVSILSHLPHSLETLECFIIEPEEEEKRETMKTSLLQPNLTHLEAHVRFIFDAPLPQKLRFFEACESTMDTIFTQVTGNTSQKGFSLPPRLEYAVQTLPLPPPTFFRHARRVRIALVETESQLNDLLASQEEGILKCLKSDEPNLRILKPLPSSIKEMYLNSSMHGEDVHMLPRGLTNFSIYALAHPTLPPTLWTSAQVRDLPLRFLVSLSIPFYLVGDGSKLAPISELSLKILHLARIPVDAVVTAPLWLIHCLPYYLQSLALFADDGKVSTDAIRLCRLHEVVPHLRILSMKIEFGNERSLGAMLDVLPKHLEQLNLRKVHVFEVTAMSHLPKSLFKLFLEFSDAKGAPSKPLVSNKYFERLRKSWTPCRCICA